MKQTILRFERDEQHHVAVLACGHRQNVRHRPPWINNEWVLTEAGRAGRIGTRLKCKTCNEQRSKAA